MAQPVNKPFSTRLPDDVRAALRTLAQSKGLTESDLGRMFIIEKLKEVDARIGEARTLGALVIAALSDTIDFEHAQELVRQHLAPEETVSP